MQVSIVFCLPETRGSKKKDFDAKSLKDFTHDKMFYDMIYTMMKGKFPVDYATTVICCE